MLPDDPRQVDQLWEQYVADDYRDEPDDWVWEPFLQGLARMSED
jgi:hypothetical protein